MVERLDAADQDPAANLPKNAAVQMYGGELGLSALDKLEAPPSLVALKAAVAARMPQVDLPELLLEIHARLGFANGFTHASEGGARAGGVATNRCAVLLAEACNTGFEPLIRRDNAALTAELGTAELYPGRDAHPLERHLGRDPEPHPARPGLGRR